MNFKIGRFVDLPGLVQVFAIPKSPQLAWTIISHKRFKSQLLSYRRQVQTNVGVLPVGRRLSPGCHGALMPHQLR